MASLSARNPIPRTTIQRYYLDVCEMSYDKRLKRAAELLVDPTPLIAEFSDGIAAFQSYDNLEGFYSNKSRAPGEPDPIGRIRRTPDVAWYLRRQRVLEVDNAPGLNAEYLDYEIAPARTTDRAYFDDGRPWSTGVIIDLLLASCDNRTPIVGELKIKNDKDPFTALIQMLAGTVHLVTTNQYRRLCEFVPAGRFAPAERPNLDGYILLYRFLEKPQAELAMLDEHADRLGELLMSHSEITSYLRRIACIELELGDDSKLHGTCRWQHGGE